MQRELSPPPGLQKEVAISDKLNVQSKLAHCEVKLLQLANRVWRFSRTEEVALVQEGSKGGGPTSPISPQG